MDDECGDTGVVKQYEDHCFMALIDVLGHGREAFKVAVRAEAWLLNHYEKEQDLIKMMTGLHAHLKGTRGAVVAFCRLQLSTGVLTYSGIGNIAMRVFGSTPRRLIAKDGIVGYMMSSPVEKQVRLYPGDILVLSSDGVKEHFNMDDFPGLLMGNAGDIATGFMNHLGKNNDDASCIALRYDI